MNLFARKDYYVVMLFSVTVVSHHWLRQMKISFYCPVLVQMTMAFWSMTQNKEDWQQIML